MPTIKEFREFFFRHTQVPSGAKADQEAGYATNYNIVGKGSVFNRFLKNDFPSEGIYKKLFESITFKLNVEDTASDTAQGLVRTATDAESEGRTNNGAGTFTNVVKPSQLSDIVVTTDGSDAVVGSPVSSGGLKLSILKRTIAGKFKRNFKLEIITDKSIVIDGSSKKIQLDGDDLTPGNSKLYGTNSSGVKGWYTIPVQTLPIYYSIYASFISLVGNKTLSPINEYPLHNDLIPADTILDDGDEFCYDLIGVYKANDPVNCKIYIGGVLKNSFSFANTEDSNVIINYKTIYGGSNNHLLVITIDLHNILANLTTRRVYYNIITFDPTINNSLQFAIETLAVGADQFILNRAKITFGKIL